MIGSSRALRVFAYAGPCDLRKSYDGLAGLVANELRRDLLDGDLFLFVNRRRNRAKVLFFDGTGVCIYMKRMDKGRFPAPWRRSVRELEMTMSELALFLEGAALLERMALSPQRISPSDLASSARI